MTGLQAVPDCDAFTFRVQLGGGATISARNERELFVFRRDFGLGLPTMSLRYFLFPLAPFVLVSACSDDGPSADPTPAQTTTEEPDKDSGPKDDEREEDAATTAEPDEETLEVPVTTEPEPADTTQSSETTIPDEPTVDTSGGELTTGSGEASSCVDIYNCFLPCETEECLDVCAQGQQYEDVLYAYYLYTCTVAFQCTDDACLLENCSFEAQACVYGTVTTDAGETEGACPTPTGEGTEHAGFIEADEVWSAADSPHVVTSNVSVRGANVTIEPCAVVLVAEGAYISVGQTGDSPAASLVAKGEMVGDVLRPVTFSPAVEDTYWGGISALPTGSLELELAVVSRAGHSNGVGVGVSSAVLAYGDDNRAEVIENVSLKHVLIDQSASLGLAAMASGGFTSDSTNVTVTNAGLEGERSGDVVTTYAGYVEAPAIHTWPLGDYTSNAIPEVLLKAPFILQVPETIPDRGVAYQMVASFSMRPPTSEPIALTVEPGVTIKFANELYSTATGMVLGDLDRPLQLLAAGTEEAPIVFTSGTESPAAGDWSGIWWESGPSEGSVMSHVVIEYGGGESATNGFGCGPGDNDSLLFLAWEPSSSFISNCTFRHSSTGGIVSGWQSDVTVDLATGNTFESITNACNVSLNKSAAGTCPDNGGDPSCY